MVFTKRVACVVAIAVFSSFTGCGSSGDTGGGGSSMDQMASAVGAQNAALKKAEDDRKAEEARKAAEAAKTPLPPQIETVTANSMKKGKSLEGGGYLSAVTHSRFFAEHQLILDNIRHAMDLYNAEHGNYPKTQEEFMKQIIEPNEPSTKLPELPEGWEYFYDPKDPLELKMINKSGSGDANAVQ
jgi:outer membrane murein-binding lipoprotein Lpp